MADFDNTNSGALFTNDRKQDENHPDLNGTINIEGKEYWLSGWKKKSKAGKAFLSLSARPKDEQAKGAAKPSGRKPAPQAEEDFI